VQEPDKLNTEALKSALPRGTTTITATHGGLNVTNPDTGDTIVIATAAVEAFLPKQV
jgi:NADPH-dependent curcumin reductase CurA